MTEITCKRCGASKPPEEFGDDSRTENGKARTCRACKKPSTGRPKGGGNRVKKQKRASATPAAGAEASPTLRLEAGFGVQASVTDDGRLQLEQADAEGKIDTIVLSRTEAKVLFAQFGEWAT
jgi:hypothetical protein